MKDSLSKKCSGKQYFFLEDTLPQNFLSAFVFISLYHSVLGTDSDKASIEQNGIPSDAETQDEEKSSVEKKETEETKVWHQFFLNILHTYWEKG